MSKINIRLNEVIKYLFERKIIHNQQHLAEILNVHPTTLSQYVRGNRKINQDFVSKLIENFPQISGEWFVFSKGDMIQPGDETEKISVSEPIVNYQKREIDADVLETIKNFSKSFVMQNEHISSLIRIVEKYQSAGDDGKKKSAV